MNTIKANNWKDCSGRQRNPGKRYLRQLAARCIREFHHHRDNDGLSYVSKALIFTGMARNTKRLREVKKITPQPRHIVRKHHSVLDAARSHIMQQQLSMFETRLQMI